MEGFSEVINVPRHFGVRNDKYLPSLSMGNGSINCNRPNKLYAGTRVEFIAAINLVTLHNDALNLVTVAEVARATLLDVRRHRRPVSAIFCYLAGQAKGSPYGNLSAGGHVISPDKFRYS
jgi:hypothetical protein